MLKKPVIVVNCKTYKQGTGANAVRLAKICEHVALELNVNIAIAVQALDVAAVAAAVDIPVLAQHVDGVDLGQHTGAIAPEALQFAGAAGSLINHSEWKIPLPNIIAAVKQCRAFDLDVIACADTPANAKEIAKAKPAFIAIEPPELIGGKISVSAARPEVITHTTSAVRIPVLCGAGIHTRQDVAKAIELGAVGVLVASGVVLAKNPEAVLKELVLGLRQ
ncbi:MAG TPA: triose-phosphate isomerase [Candidatus Binatia bacterium]|nr:triose-phosphate isomerase [Candidatus Binatia bacterium]